MRRFTLVFVRTYRELFSVPEFRVLFAATSLNVAAGSVASLALGTVTYAETGSPVLSAFMMFGGPLVRLAASWFLLSLADLWLSPRPALMVACGAIAGGNALQAIPHLPIALRLMFLILPWILLSATSGTMVALISDVVPEGAFVFARSTSNIAVGVMQIVGFSLGGSSCSGSAPLSCSWDPPSPTCWWCCSAASASATTRRAPGAGPSAGAARSTDCCSGRGCCARSTSRSGSPTDWSSAARR